MVEDWQQLLKTRDICSLGKIVVSTKSIFLLAGQSLAGKTITCLHLVNDAIQKNNKVVYIDTEDKSIMTRPHPNLFKEFYNKNQKLFDSNFIYINILDETKFFNLLDEKKPDLLVIDSLYQPFLKKYDEPKTRSKQIKDFLTYLRDYVYNNSLGCVITTPVGRVVEPKTKTTPKKENLVPLGGEGIKYLSDIKILIQFVEEQNKDSETSDRRLFVIDRQERIAFKIEYGGHLIPIK